MLNKSMSKFKLNKIKNLFRAHKIISIISVVLLIVACYFGYKYFFASAKQTTYLVSEIKKGTIVTTVSGSGQVSAKSQIDIKPKASGEVVYVGAKTGDYVSAGQLIVSIDAHDAKIALESAKLSLEKAKASAVSDGTSPSQNYEEALNNINEVFIDLPSILNGVNSILNNYTVSTYKDNLPNNAARNYLSLAIEEYNRANNSYNQTLNNFRSLTKNISDQNIVNFLAETYTMLKQVSSAVKQTNTFVTYTYDVIDEINRTDELTTDRSNLNTWIKTIDTDLSSLSSSRNTIKSANLDIKSQELTVAQKESDYQNYFLRAPFDGIIGNLDVTLSDTISSGSSIGTFVTNQKIAEITLNEVDISKVKAGQKATLTFDAIEDFSLTGVVTEVDAVGSVSSGVVSYGVKISFDTQDTRVLPGMSVSANIATDVKQDVLVVSNSAIKTTDGKSTVVVAPSNTEVTEEDSSVGVSITGATSTQVVTTGISDDTNTEILSGLKEGDKVIIKTIVSTATKTSAPSILSAAGMNNNRSGSKSNTTTSSKTSTKTSNESAGGPPPGM